MMEQAAIVFGLEHFHNYLYGQRRFKVFTDHKPLTAALNKVKAKTLQRLQDKTLAYNFTTHYKKGEEMGTPDYLSRNLCTLETLDLYIASLENPIDIEENVWIKSQRHDWLWGPCFKLLETQASCATVHACYKRCFLSTGAA